MKKSRLEEMIRENKLKKAAKKRFKEKRERDLLTTKPLLNKQETHKKVKRKMDQILIDLVNKLTKSQYNTLSKLVGSGDSLNKNKDRQHANEQIFLNNLIRNITGKTY